MFKSLLLKFVKSLRNDSHYCCSQVPNVLHVLQSQNVGEKIEVKGWVKSLRKQKENVFVDISDGSTGKKLQVLVPQKLFPAGITAGASITAEGILSLSPRGQIELSAENIKIVGKCVLDSYPFAPRKQYQPEYIRQYLHLRPRTNTFSSILRVRSSAVLAIHKYLNSEGYTNVHTPVLTSNDCEGAGEVFKAIPDDINLLKTMVKDKVPLEEAFFDTKTFLSVSGQLHLEAAAHALSKVYTFGPTFRAENSRTRFHLSEFYMLEAEIAFLDNIQDLIMIIEKLIKHVTKSLLDASDNDLKFCHGENKLDLTWINKNFPILTYDEAVAIIKKRSKQFKAEFDDKVGISKEHEIFLVNYCGGIPTFIINWPKSIKPFYMRECENDSTRVASLDLLAPGVGEIVGGSLRENDYNKLKEKLPNSNAQLNWYLDLRKYGGVPTGGFGLGFERYLLLLLGINNIKDVIPFPRWPHNCSL
ncbi:hypothetical protein NQ314_020408 [Rhamnusium bicolor]|uniref:asparagine--tRNA ligase n=1 Tax=Rhamnusium bicolor TaxID=1586634 RepID=A0AAV8WLM6_9CUCU|nr:hypothetical protein NQ314_020408 [Rhamnusium bicolor]